MGVPSNGTFGYIWKLSLDDGPLDDDPQCLSQLYQSTVSPERDLASGLVGTILICKYESIDTRGKLVREKLIHTTQITAIATQNSIKQDIVASYHVCLSVVSVGPR